MRLCPDLDPNQAVTSILIRPRVASLFSFSHETRVVVLLGPAGSGKSVAVRSCARDSVWLTFSVGDAGGSFARFVRGFARAIGGVAPGAQASFPRAWERALQTDYPESVLARWLCEHLRFVDAHIAIDDLHDATADRRIAAFISELVRLRSNKHFIISARAPGLLPIALWMATGIMRSPIDENVLRFTSDEMRDLAATFGQKSADVSSMDVTVGSPVAFAYATATRAAGYPFGTIAHCRSFDSVAELLYSNRTPRERRFLLSASLLPELDPNLLSVAGWPDWPELRTGMKSDAPFMWETRSNGSVRFHDRFADYLAARMRTEDPSVRIAIAEQAVSVLEVAGQHGDALEVALHQDLFADVTRLLDKHGFDILESGYVDEVTEALRMVDAADISAPAVITALRGYVEARLGRFDTSEAWFRHGLEQAGDDLTRAAIASYYARELMRQLRDDAFEVLEPFADLSTLPDDVMIDIRSSLGQAYMVADRVGSANDRIVQSIAMFKAHFPAALRARVLARAAYVEFESGKVDLARRHAGQAVALAVAEGMYDVATSVYTVLYTLAYEVDDDPVACLEHLASIRECGMKSGTLRLDLYALVAMYELYAEAGDRTRLAELERAISVTDVKDSTRSFTESFLPARAMQAGWAGDFGYGYRVLAPTADRQPTVLRKALRWSEVALYAAASRDRAEADAAEAAVIKYLAQGNAPSTHRAFAALNCALSFCVLGDFPKAKVWVERADQGSIAGAQRVEAFRAAVGCILAASGSSNDVTRLLAALDVLRKVGFGGMALFIESLPLPILTASYRFPITSVGGRIAAERLDEFYHLASESESEESRLCHWLRDSLDEGTESRTLRSVLTNWTPPSVLSQRARNVAAKIRAYAMSSSTPAPIAIFTRDDDVDAKIETLIVELTRSAPLMAEHSKAVSAWCARIARRLGFDEEQIVYISRCGLLHDIGKAKIPESILNAPRQLDPREWDVMRDHAAAGARIVAAVPSLAHFTPIIRGHHERLDGRGYPDGLRAGAIPFACRIVSVADCFNAMIGRRSYRLPMSPMNALDQLDRNRGTQFDPEIVEAMSSIVTGSVVVKPQVCDSEPTRS